MGLIKNFDSLATTPERKIVLQLIETGLQAIQPKKVLQNGFYLKDSILHIHTKQVDLSNYNRVFLIAFGKGSGGLSKIIEETLGDYLTKGFAIDDVKEQFKKVRFTLGTHPLPSQTNIDFTQKVLDQVSDLTEKDLVLVVICGGGSAMFEAPYKLDLLQLDKVFDTLLKSGATISEMNTVRKHLSRVKGGGLAKHLYPAKVVSLIFSDVPGSNLSVIASGPTVKETSTLKDVSHIFAKYHVGEAISLSRDEFSTLPQDEKYFEHVDNILMLSNKTALSAMTQKAVALGYKTEIFSDRAQGDAKIFGRKLIEKAKNQTILLAGGETTIEVKGKGKGGRNQTLVLSSLSVLKEGDVFASFDTDGIDFYYFAGAIGDVHTLKKAEKLHLDPGKYLDDDNSYEFFKKTGDGILTDKLESNVSDLMIVFKK